MKRHTHLALEMLEKDFWGTSQNESALISRCYELRKKPLKDFEVEDFRMLISQQIGLKYLLPLAFAILRENILAEGDYYEGDLLKAILNIERDFWQNQPGLFADLKGLLEQNKTPLVDAHEALWDIYQQVIYQMGENTN
ncbi:hypothetical protein GC194_07250 [bacterium]|nr:hypothetical protein [bacterium]